MTDNRIRNLVDSLEWLGHCAMAAKYSIEMLSEEMDDWLDKCIGTLTPVQKSEYCRLVSEGAYPVDALVSAGRRGRWVVTKRADAPPRDTP
jgi:hypothetical protein